MTAGGNSFRNATAHKVNSYCTLAISYCTFCVGKHTILGPGQIALTLTGCRTIDKVGQFRLPVESLHYITLWIFNVD